MFFFADRRSARKAEQWVYPLYDRYKERIAYEGIGVGKGAPRWERPIIRFILRRITSSPLLLDWKGKVGKAYGYEAKQPNIFVVAPDGAILLRVVGTATPERLAQVFGTLDRALEP